MAPTNETSDASPLTPLIRVEAVSKVYGMGEVRVHALRGVDLDFNAGELLALLGASGVLSGRSTLLNILGGLDRPTEGQFWYRDRDLTAADDAALTQYRVQVHPNSRRL